MFVEQHLVGLFQERFAGSQEVTCSMLPPTTAVCLEDLSGSMERRQQKREKTSEFKYATAWCFLGNAEQKYYEQSTVYHFDNVAYLNCAFGEAQCMNTGHKHADKWLKSDICQWNEEQCVLAESLGCILEIYCITSTAASVHCFNTVQQFQHEIISSTLLYTYCTEMATCQLP